MTALPWRLSGFKKAIKKRPGLFSQGRPGSPPPELPNHDLDSRSSPLWCKRHFGNAEFLAVTAIASVRSNFRGMGAAHSPSFYLVANKTEKCSTRYWRRPAV